jgi:hypothetical protein
MYNHKLAAAMHAAVTTTLCINLHQNGNVDLEV